MDRHGDDAKTLFDPIGDLYDRVRPRYPDALFDDMLRESGVEADSFILEIGCGTGIATLPVAARGHVLLGLEPGPNLVALLWRKLAPYPGVTVLETTFEAWAAPGPLFQLVYSGQAFHWLDPATRFRKSASLLPPGGTLAIFGHVYAKSDEGFDAAQEAVYAQHAPALAGASNTSWYAADGPIAGLIEESGSFAPPAVRRYPWRARYSAADYRALLSTLSDHRQLPEAKRERLLDALAATVDRFGGEIERAYETTLFLARRNERPIDA